MTVLLKNISSVTLLVMLTSICVLHFSTLVSNSLQKCGLVWYGSKHGLSHSPTLHSQHFNFILISLFLTEHTHTLNSLTLHTLVLRLLSGPFWLDHGWARLPCLVVWSWGTLPTSCIRFFTIPAPVSVWIVSVIIFNNNEVRMINAKSRRWKNTLIVHFQVHLLME